MTTKVNTLSESLLAAIETDAKLIEAAWNKSPRFYDDNYIELVCFTKNLRKKAGAELQAKKEAPKAKAAARKVIKPAAKAKKK
jgi:hypothetical protein